MRLRRELYGLNAAHSTKANAGKPIARLIAYVEPTGPRTPGCWRGQVWMADDFDETPEDIINSFYGEET